MIRFRFREDEERFYELLSETREEPLRIRSEAKLHEMIFLEGVRQGVALSALATLVRESGGPDYTVLKAYQLHAMIYGSADTPLRNAELEWLEKMGVARDERSGDALDAMPMRFAPESSRTHGTRALLEETSRGPKLDYEDEDDEEDVVSSEMPAQEEPASGRTFAGKPLFHESDFMPEHPVHSPQVVETIREHVQASARDWSSWQEMVLDLQGKTHLNAALVDIVLNTPIGRAMLAQSGVHLSPDAALKIPG